tara:strand:+ start:31 stop:303 length:273 start_codon:yes stop_codon:yes gene_type:complete
MSTFLSETSKPKLIESKIIKKMISQQNNQVTFESKVKTNIINFSKDHYQVIIGCLFILGCLYWRYNEINQRRNKQIKYEEDSDDISSEES